GSHGGGAGGGGGWSREWVRRVVVRAAVAVAIVGLLGLAAAVGVLWYYGRDLPSIEALQAYNPPQTTRIVDREGRVLGEVFQQRRTVVPMDRIPRVLVLSVLAAEDADFYRHEGLDYKGIARALIRDVLHGGAVQGASTITQQVVKIMLLTPQRTISRKLRELIIAQRLERALTKDQILHLYLNQINFGHGRYGVQEAARYYFGKDVSELSLAEASLIAGIPQAPGRLSPREHPEAARRRQLYVLGQLAAKRAAYWPDLTIAQIDAARDAEVHLADVPTQGDVAPEVVEIAKDTLRSLVDADAMRRGGYTVHTTIDADLEASTRAALQSGLVAVDERHGYQGPLKAPRARARRSAAPKPVSSLRVGGTYDAVVTSTDDAHDTVTLDAGGHPVVVSLAGETRYNPEGLAPSAFAEVGARARISVLSVGQPGAPGRGRFELGPEGAVVVLDPRTREVLALVGGYDAKPGFDRATRALRQPGSTFKALVYALAIHSREYTAASQVLDAPVVYDKWRPHNDEPWRNDGPVSIRTALAKSINLAAIRVLDQLGPTRLVDFAEQLGITSSLDPTLSLALGASGVRPIELVDAYATFAAGGRWEATRIVKEITGPDGRRVPLPQREAGHDVLTPAEAYVVTNLLESVIDDGTGRRARVLDRPLAGKTGTSNDARDAWFIGYSPRVVAGVWVGFDDHRSLGRREAGARTALPIWIDTMRAADPGDPLDFAIPPGVVTVRIDPATGLLAYPGTEGTDEVFVAGTEPTETAPPPGVADPSTFLMEQLGASASGAAPGGADGGPELIRASPVGPPKAPVAPGAAAGGERRSPTMTVTPPRGTDARPGGAP
ncbi:MAG: PBP1A family penicillin-binding protein, partial [Myxococcales bacterium]|nr:PBP1A family penicillin-binding protein [Myxococcales bacterium]